MYKKVIGDDPFPETDKKNEVDIEKFLSTRLKLKPDEQFDVYEISVDEEQSVSA